MKLPKFVSITTHKFIKTEDLLGQMKSVHVVVTALGEDGSVWQRSSAIGAWIRLAYPGQEITDELPG